MKIRFRFTKEGELCYVGHLDMMRYFQKAIRRAHIDVAYSQGFNPHQILSFASPLGLGITSEGEYFDAELKSCEKPSELVSRLNAVLSEGVRVTGARLIPEEGKYNAMATLSACRYRISFNECEWFNGLNLPVLWKKFINQPVIMLTKQTKTTTMDIDIKPLIHEWKWQDSSLEILLSAGSAKTIKATAVLDRYLSCCGIELSGIDAFRKAAVSICRVDQYTEEDGQYLSLGQIGEEL